MAIAGVLGPVLLAKGVSFILDKYLSALEADRINFIYFGLIKK